MDPLQTVLSELKESIQTASDLAEPFRLFMSNVGENLEFIHRSKKTRHQRIFDIIKAVVEKRMNHKFSAKKCLVLSVDGAPDFFHGACQFGGTIINVFYFQDIGVGMLATSTPSESKMIDYYRFRLIEKTDKDGPSAVHDGSTTVH
ncbi:MAG: hypothetical protein HQL82_06165 [Magnetococcales bacterium]|nr:hypothetical protein [Magnetococcales bacterium]